METIIIILTRSLDLTAQSLYQNSHVSNLVETLEPIPAPALSGAGAFAQWLHLNRSLPILSGFFPSRREKAGLGLIIAGKESKDTAILEPAKDHCESCGNTRADGAELHFHKGLRITLCEKESRIYRKTGEGRKRRKAQISRYRSIPSKISDRENQASYII